MTDERIARLTSTLGPDVHPRLISTSHSLEAARRRAVDRTQRELGPVPLRVVSTQAISIGPASFWLVLVKEK